MPKPVILAVDDDPEVLNAVDRDLRQHFRADYRVIKVGSGKHALALTNRGTATSGDVVALARRVRDGVADAFGIRLVPEPVLIGAVI